MNTPSTTSNDPAAIRREIDETRRRMDDTIDAIGRRLTGRHLIDEALHLIRIQQENGNMTTFTNKLSDSADSAYRAVVDTVKTHPVPTALVGAGLAWLIIEKTRSGRDSSEHEHDVYQTGFYGDNFGGTAPAVFDDYPERSETDAGEDSGLLQGARQKAGEVADSVKSGVAHLRDRSREVGSHARELSRQARQRTQELYTRGRERVSSAVDKHPLESGLVCLAVGFLAGLALPTSPRVRRAVAPGARALRGRAQDLMRRGEQVVRTAAEAARQEAAAQGLTGSGKGGVRKEATAEKPTDPAAAPSQFPSTAASGV
ncbi:MAG TPA: DUF3618 domain-containing protein [Lacunisphaera sp.]